MEKYFSLCIDGWLVKNNEILNLESCQEYNMLDLYRIDIFKHKINLKIDFIKRSEEVNFIFTYRSSYNNNEIVLEMSKLGEVQKYLDSHLQGSFYIEGKKINNYYFPLKITKGWFARWNHLIISEKEADYPSKLSSECLIPDIACFEYKTDSKHYILDVGYTEGQGNEDIYIQLIKGQDWLNPLIEYCSQDMSFLVKRINEIFSKISYEDSEM